MKVLKPTTIPFPSSGQFIRGSTATYIEDGILKTAAINEPRWQDGKLLLETEATNLMQQSSVFPNAVWVVNAATLTATTAAPEMLSISPGIFVPNTVNTFHEMYQMFNTKAGDKICAKWVVKSSGYNYIQLLFPGAVSLDYSNFDLASGSIVAGTGTSTIRSLSNGWFLISIETTAISDSTTARSAFAVVSDGNAARAGGYFAGNNTSGVIVGWCQVEIGTNTSYIPTTTAPVTRAADVCVGNFSRASTATYIDNNGVIQTAGINEPRIQDGKLLVEGEATNLQLYSQDLSSGAYANCSRGPSAAFYAGSVPFWYVSKLFNSPYEYCEGGRVSVSDGEQIEASCAFLAGNSAVCEVALYGHGGSQRGDTADATLEVLSGPGYFSAQSGSGGELVNLSATKPTLIRIRRVQRGADGSVALIFYPGGITNTVIGESIQATRFQLHVGGTSLSYIPTTTSPVTRAADIHTAGLVYTNATDSRPLWSSAVTHSVGQVIRYNNTVYESLQSSNLNKQPDTNPTWWLSLGADNISAAFDGKVGSKTTAADKLRMIVYPGTQVDAVGYLETNAVVVNTSVVDTYGNIAYSNSTGFTESNIESWYDYFFVSPLADPATQVVHQGIPSLDPGLFVGIEMINPGNVEVGGVLTGYSTTIGKTQYGLKAGIVDYSKKETDEFGNVSIIERPYSKRMQGDVYVNNYDLNKVQRFLYNIRATPVLWMASDNPELSEVSYVYGFYKDFSTTIAYPDVSMCNLDIEGLI